jgi:hypothetical protein
MAHVVNQASGIALLRVPRAAVLAPGTWQRNAACVPSYYRPTDYNMYGVETWKYDWPSWQIHQNETDHLSKVLGGGIYNFRDCCCHLYSSFNSMIWQYLHILEASVQYVTQLGGRVDFLCPFILSHVSGLIWYGDRSNKGTASNFV